MGKLLELILHMNHFEFNTKLYLQISGTAMGTSCAPSLANLFMGRFEKILLENYPNKPVLWLRFIDGIFLIWTHGEEELNDFVKYVNSVHHTIKFTCNYNREAVEFLDTRVILDPTTYELFTTLYTKPTDTRDYLFHTSAHPLSTKNGGPYGQFLRLRRICTKDYDFNMESRALFLAYRKGGYPKHILEEHFHKGSLFNQDELLDIKIKEKSDRQVFVTTYNPANPNLMGIIKNYWPILHTSRTLAKIFPQEPLCAFRCQKNLIDMLVSTKLTYLPVEEEKIVFHLKNTTCPTITCRYCRIMDKSDTITSSFLEKLWKKRVGCRSSCLTDNVVYLIICLKCNSQYIGETKCKLRQRMYEHIRSVESYGPN